MEHNGAAGVRPLVGCEEKIPRLLMGSNIKQLCLLMKVFIEEFIVWAEFEVSTKKLDAF